jgi:hypothetical protein
VRRHGVRYHVHLDFPGFLTFVCYLVIVTVLTRLISAKLIERNPESSVAKALAFALP